MRKGATTLDCTVIRYAWIVALRNEKGSYNVVVIDEAQNIIVALRNEKGSYNSVSL